MAAAGNPSDVITIVMPELGNTMEEGTIVSWNKREGDCVEVGEVLCEIETDKAVTEYESPYAGRLARIVAELDKPIAVKEPIAYFAEDDADVEPLLGSTPSAATQEFPIAASKTASPRAAVQVEPFPSTPSVPPPPNRQRVSPAARMLAAEQGIDISTITQGSGPGGRIISKDVASGQPMSPTLSKGSPSPVVAQGVSAATSGQRVTGQGRIGQPTRRPLTKMRRAIANGLQRSKQTIPHFYVKMTVRADHLYDFYRRNKSVIDCSLNDLIVWACGRALVDYPALRSRIDGDEYLEMPSANIGVAVDVPDGLVVPVIIAVDQMTLEDLAAESKRIIANARNGKLENLGQGVFTISNLGMLGVEEFSAIINPPESAILAVGALREEVLVENGNLQAARVISMTISADHRVVDGATAARFLGRLKEVLESIEAYTR